MPYLICHLILAKAIGNLFQAIYVLTLISTCFALPPPSNGHNKNQSLTNQTTFKIPNLIPTDIRVGKGIRHGFEEDIKDLINDSSMIKISKNEYFSKDDVNDTHNSIYNFQEQVKNRSNEAMIGRFRQRIYQSPINNTYVGLFEEEVPIKNIHKYKKISNMGSIGGLSPFFDYDNGNWFNDEPSTRPPLIVVKNVTKVNATKLNTYESFMGIYGQRNISPVTLRDYLRAYIFDRELLQQEYCNDTSIIGPNRPAILRALNKRIMENRKKYENSMRKHRWQSFMKYGKGSYNIYTLRNILANNKQYRSPSGRPQGYGFNDKRDNLRRVVGEMMESLSDANNLRKALKNEIGQNVNYTFEGQLDGLREAVDRREEFYKIVKRLLHRTLPPPTDDDYEDCADTDETDLTEGTTIPEETDSTTTTTSLSSDSDVTIRKCRRRKLVTEPMTEPITLCGVSTTTVFQCQPSTVVPITNATTPPTTPMDWNDKMYKLKLETNILEGLLSQAAAMPWFQQISENRKRLFPDKYPCPVRKLGPGENPFPYGEITLPTRNPGVESSDNEDFSNSTDTTVSELVTDTTTELSESEQRSWMDDEFKKLFLKKYLQSPVARNSKFSEARKRFKRTLVYMPVEIPSNAYKGPYQNMAYGFNGC